MINIFNIVNTICVAVATITGIYVAYIGYKKHVRYNLIDIEITIIEDEERINNFWYVKYRFSNCQKTIDKVTFKVKAPFEIYNVWESELLHGKYSQSSDTLELSGVFDNDYVILCLTIERRKSDFYRKKVEKMLTAEPILTIDSKFTRLQKKSFSYSQLYYAQQ